MIGMQSQMVLQRRMEAVANNLANLGTDGFKADNFLFAQDVDPGANSRDKPSDVRFVKESGIVRDMAQGPIRVTSNPFDVALEGDGFFAVQTDEGTAYTRDGGFTVSAEGTLVTKDGKSVLSDSGAPIVFDLRGQSPVIDTEGAISINGVEAGRIGVYTFEKPDDLQKMGDNLYTAGSQVATKAENTHVVQGAVESSNVRAIVEMTRMIEISRAYESASRMVNNDDTLRKSAIETLGKAA
jgi:flagellar basal-body rod protein FlgF